MSSIRCQRLGSIRFWRHRLTNKAEFGPKNMQPASRNFAIGYFHLTLWAVFLAHLSQQPHLRESPITLYSFRRYFQDLGRLSNVQPAEKPELYYLALSFVKQGQRIQCVVQVLEACGRAFAPKQGLI